MVDWEARIKVGDHWCHVRPDVRTLTGPSFSLLRWTWSNPATCIPFPLQVEVFCPVGALSGLNKHAIVSCSSGVEVWTRED